MSDDKKPTDPEQPNNDQSAQASPTPALSEAEKWSIALDKITDLGKVAIAKKEQEEAHKTDRLKSVWKEWSASDKREFALDAIKTGVGAAIFGSMLAVSVHAAFYTQGDGAVFARQVVDKLVTVLIVVVPMLLSRKNKKEDPKPPDDK